MRLRLGACWLVAILGLTLSACTARSGSTATPSPAEAASQPLGPAAVTTATGPAVVPTTAGLGPAETSTDSGTPASNGDPVGEPAPIVPVSVQVSVSHCGDGWNAATAGTVSLDLHNTDINPGEAYLVVVDSGAVVAEVEDLGPGSSAMLTVRIPGGRYALRCAMEDSDPVTGPTVSVSGSPGSAGSGYSPAIPPVSQAEMIGPTKRYEAYVIAHLPGLAVAARRVRDDIAADDLGMARTDWLTAHLDYERLGAAYGAFGDADDAVNGVPSGLAGGVDDPDFTGFHRIEYGLWHGQTAVALSPLADRLVKDVEGLVASFPTSQIDPLDVAIRAHEITENALQFELTAQTDFGSGSNLATVRANLDGTLELITILSPLLSGRYPDLAVLHRQWQQAVSDLEAQHHGAAWTPVSALSRTDREHIDADISQLAELLAPIASICEPRRTS